MPTLRSPRRNSRQLEASKAAVLGRLRTWIPLMTLAGGVFVSADDQTSVVTVLPAIVQGLGITVDEFYQSAWIVNGYLLGYLVALPVVGRIADVYGHARVYVASLALFMIGSAFVAAAPSLEWLVVTRSLQAVGGGAVVPVAMAIVVGQLAPSQRLMGLATIAAASEAGALIGPLWGGAIAQWLGWRWVFWINLPMAVPFLLSAWRYVGSDRGSGRVDIPGAAFLVSAMALLTIALIDDPVDRRELWLTISLIVGSAMLAILFVIREKMVDSPMVRMAMFAPRAVWASLTATFLSGGALIVALLAVPLFVNLVLSESPLSGGLTLMRLTIAVAPGVLIGGFLATRIGLRTVAVTGMWITVGGFLTVQAWDRDLSEFMRTVPLLLIGFGFGFVIAPLSAAVLQQVGESERATAAAWLTLSRIVGMLVGASLLTTHGLGRFYGRVGGIEFDSEQFEVLVRTAQVSTFREVFIAAAVLMSISGLVAWLVGNGEKGSSSEQWWRLT